MEGTVRIPRRTFLHLAARAGSFAAVTYSAAYAQSWPSGPIRIVVPFAPGGSTDVIARLAQPGLQQRLGTTVITENRPGGSGTIGAGIVAKSPPDGTLGCSTCGAGNRSAWGSRLSWRHCCGSGGVESASLGGGRKSVRLCALYQP